VLPVCRAAADTIIFTLAEYAEVISV